MSALTDRIYRLLPAWGQDLAISAYGVKYRQERLGGSFREDAAGFRERDAWRPDEMEVYVASALRRTLLHAFDQVPYYREKWRAAGIRRPDLERILPGGLSALPATPKEDLRRAPEAFLADDARARGGLHRYYTSGSTGTPVTVVCTSGAHRRFIAARDVRSFGWAGAGIQLPRAMLGGRMVVPGAAATGRPYRYNFVERQVYFSAYHLRPDTAAAYVAGFNRHRPLLLTGYAHSYDFLARLMLAQGLKLDYEPRCLVLSSEKTTPAMKETIARAFRARAYEEYGSVENCALATECEYGSLHVSPDFGVVEIVGDRGEPIEPGGAGRVLCTGLLNEAQPLVRYEIGDVASWSRTPCPCGRDQLPVLAAVEGRLEDAVIGPDGRQLVRFHGLFINVKGVLEAQVVQERIDLLRVRVVATPEFGEPERALIGKRVDERLGPLVHVRVETVDRIERTSRGKFRAVISRLSPPAAQPASGTGAP